MKVLVVLCFVAAVAQATHVDWTKIDTMQVAPANIVDKLQNSAQDDLVTRIVGGDEATPGQFPYQVILFAKIPQGTGVCGGSILNEYWVLTAAHCVRNAESIELIIGAHNVVDGDEDQFRVLVSRVIIHRLYNMFTMKNDIALLELPSALKYSSRVQPIRLPSRLQARQNFVGRIATVSGWGLDDDSATAISPVLRYTSNPILANSRCNLYYFNMLVDTQICLAGTGGRSSCQGDSGGPLVITDTDGELTQVGLVSHGIAFGCASGWPGVYARVSSYLDWIETNTLGSVKIRNE